MTITEKAAYLKGLVEGQGMDPETGEGKLWNVLSELVGDLASEVRELRKEQEGLSESVENVEIGLEYLEDLLQDDYDGDDDDFDDGDFDDGDDSFGDVYPFPGSSSYADGDDDNGQDDDYGDEEVIYYEVECPGCGEIIEFNDETLEKGAVRCPGCGAMLSFDPVDSEDGVDDAADGEAEGGPPEAGGPEE